jgi:hypothetical protein
MVRSRSAGRAGLLAILLATAGALNACTSPGATATPAVSAAPSDGMIEHSPSPSDGMMEHSPSPSDGMMEHSPSPS